MKSTTIFERAAGAFEGWRDPETGLRILKIAVCGQDVSPRVEPNASWRTWDHQFRSFLQGGRQLLARGYPLRPGIDGHEHGVSRPIHLIDLATGEVTCPFPRGFYCWEVRDTTNLAVLQSHAPGDARFIVWDLSAERVLCTATMPGWEPMWGIFLSDERRAIVSYIRGRFYDELCRSRLLLLEPDGNCRQIHSLDGYMVNHIVGCPTDPDLFSYNRWPSPKPGVLTEEVLHVRSVDGTFEQRLPLLEETVRPGPVLGGRRDHYLWMPDGKRIASYFLPGDLTSDKPYDWEWWLSLMDWRTGQDLSLPYPPQRWGGNYQISPDGRFIIATGGEGFHRLFVVDVEKLAAGWNERLLCTYPEPRIASDRYETSLNRHPHMLPDGSGVVFTGGYPGPQQGIYMVEWPSDLKTTSRAGTDGARHNG